MGGSTALANGFDAETQDIISTIFSVLTTGVPLLASKISADGDGDDSTTMLKQRRKNDSTTADRLLDLLTLPPPPRTTTAPLWNAAVSSCRLATSTSPYVESFDLFNMEARRRSEEAHLSLVIVRLVEMEVAILAFSRCERNDDKHRCQCARNSLLTALWVDGGQG
jgi:hypothetical protein